MAMAFLIASSSRAEEFAAFARDLDPALDVRVAPNLGKAEEIEYALAWQPPNGLLKTLPPQGQEILSKVAGAVASQLQPKTDSGNGAQQVGLNAPSEGRPPEVARK